ncbi:hypothetical protein O3M35_007854 [Rhynocoris fuscipes]|uniref:Ionotropic receptor n=1 Tax=Rhynocoris fuscipes TaxID=488301 RepID=A0AAW1DB06_9HEMI
MKTFSGRVYLAKFSKNQITVNEVYSVSDKLVTNAIITWSNDDNNKRNELGLAYLKMLMYRRNMQGIIVNLLAFHDPPFVIINNGTNSTESPSIKGFLIDLWMIMEKERKFRTQIHYANSTAEGYLLKDETKTKIYSSGLLKEAEELQSDVTLMLRQDSTNFTNMFDATTSILTLRLGIYQKISRPGVWQLINQMPTIILFILLIFGILCGILLRLRRSGDSVVIVFASYFQQGYSMLPSNTSARFAVISLILCSTYVITINLAEVTALIIIRPSPKPLTLYDMLDPARKILIVQNSSLHNIMKENDTNLLGMILSRVKLNHGFVNSIYEGLQQVETHGFILLEFQERVSYYFIDFECSISRTLTDHRIYTALLVNWTLPYLTLIDYELIQMRENGILSKLIQKWWPERITYCMDKFEIVGLEKCWSLFAIYIYGAIIAVLILISEKNIPDYMKTRKKTTAEK